jgi:hypothetical protein
MLRRSAHGLESVLTKRVAPRVCVAVPGGYHPGMQLADCDNRNIERHIASDRRFHPRQIRWSSGLTSWEIDFYDPATGDRQTSLTQAEALSLKNELDSLAS